MNGMINLEEKPSTLCRMMNRASSFRSHTDDKNCAAVMALTRASSFRTPRVNRPSLMKNRASSYRHIPTYDSSSVTTKSGIKFDRNNLNNIWLVDDTPVEGLDLRGNKWAKACIGLVVVIIVTSVFVYTAVNSWFTYPASGDTNFSSNPRLNKIIGFLSETTSISSKESLHDSSSPQSRAARWLASNDFEKLTILGSDAGPFGTDSGTTNLNAVKPFNLVQRYVLLVIYFALGGDTLKGSWTNDYSFATQDRHECSWYERTVQVGGTHTNIDDDYSTMGVACDRDLLVRSISLPVNNLKGSIPSEIQFLTTLNFLDLSGNQLSGSIPEGLQNLSQLQYLDLSSNRLTGHISPVYWLGKGMAKLEFLNLSDNLLCLNSLNTSYSQSFSFAGDQRLKTLALGGNINDDGEEITICMKDNSGIVIPDEIQYLTSLQELFLGCSNIGGTVPVWIFHKLKKLQFLDLSRNQLVGNISEIFPSDSDAFSLPDVHSLLLHDNGLTGTLPESIGLMPNLSIVTIHHTNMTVGTNLANHICWQEEGPSVLESIATDCGDATCPCCLEDCCDSNECYQDVDWYSGSIFAAQRQNEDDEDEH